MARKDNGLDFGDLSRWAQLLLLPVANSNRKELLKRIFDKVSDGTENWAKHVMELDGQGDENSLDMLVENPLVEATYDELPDEDKAEWSDLKNAFQQKRARHKSAHARLTVVQGTEAAPPDPEAGGVAAGPSSAAASSSQAPTQPDPQPDLDLAAEAPSSGEGPFEPEA